MKAGLYYGLGFDPGPWPADRVDHDDWRLATDGRYWPAGYLPSTGDAHAGGS